MRNFSKNQNHFKNFVEKQNICITKKRAVYNIVKIYDLFGDGYQGIYFLYNWRQINQFCEGAKETFQSKSRKCNISKNFSQSVHIQNVIWLNLRSSAHIKYLSMFMNDRTAR